MNDHTAFVVFVAVVCGGLALVTVAMLATAIALWKKSRSRPPGR